MRGCGSALVHRFPLFPLLLDRMLLLGMVLVFFESVEREVSGCMESTNDWNWVSDVLSCFWYFVKNALCCWGLNWVRVALIELELYSSPRMVMLSLDNLLLELDGVGFGLSSFLVSVDGVWVLEVEGDTNSIV